MDEMQDLSDQFGQALEELTEVHMEAASVEGGGLRHGAPEWHITYRQHGLFRLIVFNVEEDNFGDLRLRVHVGATDEEGGWAQHDLGSTILHRHRFKHIDSGDLKPLVEQAQQLADSFSEDDLKLLTIGWGTVSAFRTDRDGVGEDGVPSAGTRPNKSTEHAAAKKSAKAAQKKATGSKKSTKKQQKKKAAKKAIKKAAKRRASRR